MSVREFSLCEVGRDGRRLGILSMRVHNDLGVSPRAPAGQKVPYNNSRHGSHFVHIIIIISLYFQHSNALYCRIIVLVIPYLRSLP